MKQKGRIRPEIGESAAVWQVKHFNVRITCGPFTSAGIIRIKRQEYILRNSPPDCVSRPVVGSTPNGRNSAHNNIVVEPL